LFSDGLQPAVSGPTAKDIADTAAAVTAVRQAEEMDSGAASPGGGMADAATARIFGPVLDRARAYGVV
jgi:citrate lyase beta subunit